MPQQEKEMKIQVVIPSYKPGRSLERLCDKLSEQTVKPDSIHIVNTEERYWPGELKTRFRPIKVTHISREDFDHGGTRRFAAAVTDADILVCMTQDAMPADPWLIENLVAPFRQDPAIGVTFARQLPRKESGILEKMYRDFNYPSQSYVRDKGDLKKYGIKTFFCSDVCAAYRMDAYRKAGGFPAKAIFNEDMILCSLMLNNGAKVRYCSNARVIHSHDYTCRQQFHRSFDLGVSHAQFPEVFSRVSSEAEGISMVKRNTKALLGSGKIRPAAMLWITSAARYAGYRLGKSYHCLPSSWVLRLTMNPEYWKRGHTTD